MLSRLQFENFKSWKLAEVEFAPLTAFFGANSSGKSSLLQFLLLLKQTKDSVDRSLALDFGDADSSANLGSFRDAVHGKDENAPIRWQLSWKMPDTLRIADPSGKRSEALFSSNEIKVESEARLRNKVVAGEYLVYQFDGAKFTLRREQDRPGFQLDPHPHPAFRFVRAVGRKWDLPGPIKSYAFPDQARTYFQNSQFLSEFENAYVKQMNDVIHLGPLRDSPRREYTWAGSSPVDVGPRGENAIEAILGDSKS